MVEIYFDISSARHFQIKDTKFIEFEGRTWRCLKQTESKKYAKILLGGYKKINVKGFIYQFTSYNKMFYRIYIEERL